MAKVITSKTINSVIDPATGEFKRPAARFRDFISSKPGAVFAPEKGRYHLYVSYACPWAHRTLLALKLKGLDDIVDFTSVHWYCELDGKGWRFAEPGESLPGANTVPDPVNGAQCIRDLYTKASSGYDGRPSVPVLWDKKTDTIVSNESSEIIRMFYAEFDHLLDEKHAAVDLYPEDLREKIDEMNAWVYLKDGINNGVYKCGVGGTQEAYDKAVVHLFDCLDQVEEILKTSTGPYLFGDRLTEADLRLYPTIIRFDPVYFHLFKTNLKQIRTYPELHKWVRHLYWDVPAFHETTNFEHIKKHYFTSLTMINPNGIVPYGPLPNICPKDE